MLHVLRAVPRPRLPLVGALVSATLVSTMLPFAGAALAANPAAPSTPDLAPQSDTGYSNTDNITKTLIGLVFTGTSVPSATIDVYYGGSNLIGTGTASTGGAWSVTTTNPLPDNTTSAITATATTTDGTSVPSAALNVTTDNTVPSAPSVPDLTAASDTGTSNSDNYTADTTPTFSGTAEDNATVFLQADGNQVGSVRADGSGAWTITSSTLGNGTYSFTATQTDAAGNGPSSVSGGLSVTINTNVPAPPSAPDLLAASDSGTSSTDNITSDTTPTFTGTAAVGASVDLWAGPTNVGTAIADVSGNWSITATTLAAGAYSMTATATNQAGTSLPSVALTVTIETTLTVTVNQASTQSDPTGLSPVYFTVGFTNPVTDFTASDVTVSGTAPGTKYVVIAGSGTTYSVAVSGMTGYGTVVASMGAGVVHDYAGNANGASTSTDNSVTYDPTAGPTVTINQATSQPDPTVTVPVNFTVVFSASVTGFIGSDVTISGTAPGTKSVTVTGSGTTYNVAVSGMTGSGTVIATIPADAALSSSGAHPSRASTSTDNTVTYLLPSKWIVTASNYTPAPGSTITMSAQLADASSAAIPVSGVVVTWSKSQTSGTFSSATSTTNSSGVATVTFTVANVTGTVYTVTASGNSLSGTSPTITVTALPAQITLSTSASVITWSKPVTLTAQFALSGSSRALVLQTSTNQVTWTNTANLTTNSAGTATFTWTPARNLYYRAVFAGAPDLSAANSNVTRVVVRQIALLRPLVSGVKTIARGSKVTFTTTVRPARPELPRAKVTFTFVLKRGSTTVYSGKRDVYINAAGQASWTWTFSSPGEWYVRAIADPTTANANSVWSPLQHYHVG